jgi:hypothetical protein
MNLFFNLLINLSVFVLVSCSTSVVDHKPFSLGGNLDLIPDEFENVKGEVDSLFEDKTEEFGLLGQKAYNINVIDINGDDYSDIVLIPSFYSQPRFFIFDIHKKKFVESSSPFDKSFKVSFILFYDLNQDKIIDAVTGVLNQDSEMSKQPLRIFYGSRNKNNQLSLKERETFKNATPISSAALIDYDLDGKLDIFVGNWFQKFRNTKLPAQDRLYQNTGKGYKEVSSLLLDEAKQNVDKTMFINASPTYGVQVCDIDQNGFPDIVTTSTNKYQNKLWMNRYKFREKYRFFENHALSSGVAGDSDGLINTQGGGRTFGVACADYNNDGIMDLFLGELTHNYDSEGTDKSSLLTGRTFNFPPLFYRTEYFSESDDPNWHQADRRGVWVDLNNDGLLDLIVDNSGYPPHTRLIIFEQQPDHSFTNKSKEYGVNIINPIATVTADFNRDGKMDILTSQTEIRDASIKTRLFLFQNNMKLESRKSIRFYLRGKKANYHGLNGTITLKVKTPKGISNRKQVVSYSYGALPPQNEEGIHFGINEGEQIVSVSVRWPYSKSLNQSRAGLEKTYPMSIEFKDFLNITLCEDGNYLVGRRDCF